jgi:excisionase family DNA binding protein
MTTWRQWLERNPAGRGKFYHSEFDIDLDKPMGEPHRENPDSVQSGRDLSNSSGWLTADEAAQYLQVKPRTLLLWVRQRKVKGHPLSGTKRRVWRFRQADLDATLTNSVLPSVSLSVRSEEGRL